MNLHLSWDLFILVFFALVTAYSFIIGRNQTLKIILGTYVAILCADAIGNLFSKSLLASHTFLKMLNLFSIGNEDQAVIFFKVLILIVLIVLVAVRGLFSVEAEDNRPVTIRIIILLLLGLLSAGLMLSAVLVFVSGGTLIGGILPENNFLVTVANSSRMVKIMVDYTNFWFFLPGLAFVLLGIFQKKA